MFLHFHLFVNFINIIFNCEGGRLNPKKKKKKITCIMTMQWTLWADSDQGVDRKFLFLSFVSVSPLNWVGSAPLFRDRSRPKILWCKPCAIFGHKTLPKILNFSGFISDAIYIWKLGLEMYYACRLNIHRFRLPDWLYDAFKGLF